MLDSIAAILARPCERSALLTRLLRSARFRGRCRIVSALRRVPLPDELEALCGGLRYRLDLRDDVQRSIYFDCYEPRDREFLAALVPPGGVCLDVGANVGFYSLHFARWVGPSGRVFCFEPDPRNASRLRANLSLNGYDGVAEVVEAAVADREGTATLHRSDAAHSGWGSLAAHASESGTVPVRTTTLDAFLRNRGVAHVDLIKADVEGAECELLAGAARSLAEHRFRRLFVEFNGVRLRERGKTLEDFLGPLERGGYDPAPEHAELLSKMRRGAIPPHTVWPNLLFVPREEAPRSA